MGLFQNNRLLQGLCNSPGSFMRMNSIFGNQNFLSILCYIDDLIIFGPNEQIALDHLEMEFGRLQTHGLKFAPKKCLLLRESVKFLRHVINKDWVSTDSDKVDCISKLTALTWWNQMGRYHLKGESDHFWEWWTIISISFWITLPKQNHSLIFFKARRIGEERKRQNVSGQNRKFRPEDLTQAQHDAVEQLKTSLVGNVVLAHPDFLHHFILWERLEQDMLLLPASPFHVHSGTIQLEFLVRKWSIYNKCSQWLKGLDFTILTNNFDIKVCTRFSECLCWFLQQSSFRQEWGNTKTILSALWYRVAKYEGHVL